MKNRSLVCVLACALLAISVALYGCGGDEGGPAQESLDKDALAGYWELDDTSVGFEATLLLDEDDSATLIIGGKKLKGKWSASDGKATLTLDDSPEASLSLSDKKLTLGGGEGSRLVFKKAGVEGVYEAGKELLSGDDDDDSSSSSSGSSSSSQAGADDTDDDFDENDEVDEAITPIDPVVLADDATCTITVIGKGTDFTGDPCYRLSFTNKTESALFITVEDVFTVTGIEVNAGLGDVAEPGETVETDIYFPVDELGGGLELLNDVNGVVNVEIEDSYDPVAAYPFYMA